jgi:hypothetical protein
MNKTMLKIAEVADKCRAKKDFAELEKLMLTPEVQSLSYAEKNHYFLTSSKIKEFLRCQFCYKAKYIDLIPDPTDTDIQKDHFLIGQAFDDLLTHGKEKFDEKYEVVSRRNDKAEKVQLTNTHARLVDQMEKEFKAVPIFNHKPIKKLFFWEYGGFLIKVELDDFDGEAIRDVKTCANIKTFEPAFYTIQAALYQLVVEECTDKRLPVEYEIVDKYTYFSRSKAVRYTDPTLFTARGQILEAMVEIKAAHDTGIFASAQLQETLYDCPFYGFREHGRPNQFILY